MDPDNKQNAIDRSKTQTPAEIDRPREDVGRKAGMASPTPSIERGARNVKQGWAEFKSKLSQKWDRLDATEIDTYQGRDRTSLVGFLHQKVGGERSAVERDVDSLARDTSYRFD